MCQDVLDGDQRSNVHVLDSSATEPQFEIESEHITTAGKCYPSHRSRQSVRQKTKRKRSELEDESADDDGERFEVESVVGHKAVRDNVSLCLLFQKTLSDCCRLPGNRLPGEVGRVFRTNMGGRGLS